MVATSNRPLNDLYSGGLNRHLFLPAINLLEKTCISVDMDSKTDFR